MPLTLGVVYLATTIIKLFHHLQPESSSNKCDTTVLGRLNEIGNEKLKCLIYNKQYIGTINTKLRKMIL